MSNRLMWPNLQPISVTSLVQPGLKLFTYVAGSSTKQTTYSDIGLTAANSNPLLLSADGGFGNIFLKNADYKIVLSPSTDTDPPTAPIYTFDNVHASDFSTIAQFLTNAGNPNGVIAGTAGSGTTPASAIFDNVNNILYVCTTTGTTGSAVWTAVTSTSSTQAIESPQGYLALVASDPPFPASDQIAATTIYYTPYVGNVVPIYNGTSTTLQTFAQLSLGLTSTHTADAVFDIFVFSNSGVMTLVTGPAWTNLTTRNSALTRLNGVWVNQSQITGTNGGNTFVIAANLATYLGSVYIDHTAGQTTQHVSSGQNRKWGLWNAYNRKRIMVSCTEAISASWTYGTATIRASNNNPAAFTTAAFNVGSGTTCNGISVFAGLAEENIDAQVIQSTHVDGGANAQPQVGIGYNSITAFSGTAGQGGHGADAITVYSTVTGKYTAPPALGVNIVASLEKSLSAGTVTYLGQQLNMALVAIYTG